MERIPHLLVEGMIISGYALGANTAYIYIRGELLYVYHVPKRPLPRRMPPAIWAITSWSSRLFAQPVRAPSAGATSAADGLIQLVGGQTRQSAHQTASALQGL